MTEKKLIEIAEQFEGLTIKKQMKILAKKAAESRLFFKEIMDEFEKTLLLTTLEYYGFNRVKMAVAVKMHRNTIAEKMKKLKIKEKKKVK